MDDRTDRSSSAAPGRKRATWRGFAVLGAVVAAAALAGCGGSKSPSVASVATTTSSPTAGTSAPSTPPSSSRPPSQTQVQQDSLRYARCMRANGVPNFPDPQAGGGFLFQAGTGVDPSSPGFKAARAKCQKLMPQVGPTPGSTTHPSAQWVAHMVKVAQCMPRHGISGFPDPRTSVPANPFPAGGAGVISDIEGVILIFPSTIDTQSPFFTRAAAACQFPLHNH